ELTILLGNGDGTFQPAQNYPVGQSPTFVAVGDFNGDGIPDLAVSSSGDGTGLNAGVSILLGSGDGTFQAARYYASGAKPVSLAVGDFNSDGHLDVAMADERAVNIFLGKTDGTFAAPVLYAANGAPLSL